MSLLPDLMRIALVGLGATAVMDAWLILLKRMGVPTLDMALIGRWVGHLGRGRVAHASIRLASPITGEVAWGWCAHYAVGVAFSALLVSLQGLEWLRQPSLLPALAFGLGTVAAPWLLMQPAMGAGIASSNTPTPHKNRLRSLLSHAVFGLGLYLCALLLAGMPR